MPAGGVNVLIEIALVLDNVDQEDDLDTQLVAAELAETLLSESSPAKLELDQNHTLVNRLLDFIETDSSLKPSGLGPSASSSAVEVQLALPPSPKSENFVKIKSSLARCIMISMGESKPAPLSDNDSLDSALQIQRLTSWLEYSPTRNDIQTTACISLANIARNGESESQDSCVDCCLFAPYIPRR